MADEKGMLDKPGLEAVCCPKTDMPGNGVGGQTYAYATKRERAGPFPASVGEGAQTDM